MKALKHPLWTHIPGALLWVMMVVTFGRSWPLPDPAPVHFGGDGVPDRWGAQWEMPLIVLAVSLFAFAISIAVDEFWARQERRKRFNWASLIDEVFLGFLTATTLQYVEALESTPYQFRHSWTLTVGLVLIPVLGAVLLEILRPHRASPLTRVREDVSRLENEVATRRRSGQPWVHWESQNSRYVKWYLPIFGLGLLALGFTTWNDNRWAASAALVSGVVVLLGLSGGFRLTVTQSRIRLRAGFLGIPLLKLELKDVVDAALHDFSPLADFGGYGIRRNREMSAFFLQGDRGVKLTTARGKKYLIGSEHPDRLAAVLRAAISTSPSI
jgi:hypothetical protein